MPITRKHGKVSSIAKLGQLAGKALADRRTYERREAQIFQIQQQQMQEQTRQVEMQSRQQLEEYKIQANFKQNVQAMDWEREKVAAVSQHDLMMQEQKIQANFDLELTREMNKKKEYYSFIDRIEERYAGGEGDMSKAVRDNLILRAEAKMAGIPGTVSGTSGAGYNQAPYWKDPKYAGDPDIEAMKEKELGDRTGPKPWWYAGAREGDPVALGAMEEATGMYKEDLPEGFFTGQQRSTKVRVISPQGTTGTVDENEVDDYIKRGFKRI